MGGLDELGGQPVVNLGKNLQVDVSKELVKTFMRHIDAKLQRDFLGA